MKKDYSSWFLGRVDLSALKRVEYIRSRSRTRHARIMRNIVVGLVLLFLVAMAFLWLPRWTLSYVVPVVEAEEVAYELVEAHVTGYNLVPEQTDDTPCIGASGKNLCNRRDTIACPRVYAFGTLVEVDGSVYSCEDRLAKKYDHRWDINCGQDKACPALVTGVKVIKILK